MSRVLDRRRVLRGILGTGGAVAIPLPMLDIMLNGNGTALAATGDPVPVRYVTWFFGNGALPGSWSPAATGSGDAWALTPQLAPLASVKPWLNVVSGLQMNWLPGNAHTIAAGAITTGSDISATGFGISIDQAVANVIGNGTPFKSLELGVSKAGVGCVHLSQTTISHRSNSVHLFPRFDLQEVYKLLVGAPANPVDMKALAQARGSAFDAVMEDTRQLKKQLGTADNMRLDGHLEGLQTLAKRIAALGTGMGAVPKLTAPAVVNDPNARPGATSRGEAMPEVNAAMSEMAAFALATGMTNVMTFCFTLPAAHVNFKNLGADMNNSFHDDICHGDPGNESNQPRVLRGTVYTMKCLAVFLEKLNEYKEGDRTLLDNSLVYVSSEHAWGRLHTNTNYPVLLAGRAGGRMIANQHLRFPGETLTSVLLTAANLMGLGLKQFGAGKGVSTRVLPGIMA